MGFPALARTAVALGQSPAAPAGPAGYRLVEQIGEGGLATVWRAERLADGEMVALKIAHTSGEEAALRMGAEAEALRKLRHPHIVACLDAGVTTDGTPWLAMEYVAGESLMQRLRAEGFSWEEALRLFRPVAAALAYAHAEGMLHRDLKPSNILLGADDVVKVADFGLAQPVGQRVFAISLTRSGVLAGTAEYLAPECYQPGYVPAVPAEIYALGVIFHELLTGGPPRGAWIPVSQQKKIDVRVDEWLRRALHPEPARRFASVPEMSEALEKIAHSPPRYAGAALLTSGVRWMDFFWTLLGIAAVLMIGTAVLRLGKAPNEWLPFDFFQGHTNNIGLFLSFSWLVLMAAGLAAWQAARLWRFRAVPWRERVPMPFGLALGHSRLAATVAALGQAAFCFFPLVGLSWMWSELRWKSHHLSAGTRLYLSSATDGSVPLDPWHLDFARLFDGSAYWLLDVYSGTQGQVVQVRDKASFFPFIQPLFFGSLAVFVVIAALWTLGISMRAVLRRHPLALLGMLTLGGLLAAQSRSAAQWKQQRRASRPPPSSDFVLTRELLAHVKQLGKSEEARDLPGTLAAYLPGVVHYRGQEVDHATLSRLKQQEWDANRGLLLKRTNGASDLEPATSEGRWLLNSAAEFHREWPDGSGDNGVWVSRFWLQSTSDGWKIAREEHTHDVAFRSQSASLSGEEAAVWHARLCAAVSAPGSFSEGWQPHLVPRLFHPWKNRVLISREELSGILAEKYSTAAIRTFTPHLSPQIGEALPGHRLPVVFPYVAETTAPDGSRHREIGAWRIQLIHSPEEGWRIVRVE